MSTPTARFAPREIFQPVLAEIDDANVVRQVVLDELARCVRQQNLTAVRGGADARTAVDTHADVALAADQRLAGVQSHADAERGVLRPGLGGERPLRRDGG
jgi:hypothetical protein